MGRKKGPKGKENKSNKTPDKQGHVSGKTPNMGSASVKTSPAPAVPTSTSGPTSVLPPSGSASGQPARPLPPAQSGSPSYRPTPSRTTASSPSPPVSSVATKGADSYVASASVSPINVGVPDQGVRKGHGRKDGDETLTHEHTQQEYGPHTTGAMSAVDNSIQKDTETQVCIVTSITADAHKQSQECLNIIQGIQAKLKISTTEADDFRSGLSNIDNYVKKLSQISKEGTSQNECNLPAHYNSQPDNCTCKTRFKSTEFYDLEQGAEICFDQVNKKAKSKIKSGKKLKLYEKGGVVELTQNLEKTLGKLKFLSQKADESESQDMIQSASINQSGNSNQEGEVKPIYMDQTAGHNNQVAETGKTEHLNVHDENKEPKEDIIDNEQDGYEKLAEESQTYKETRKEQEPILKEHIDQLERENETLTKQSTELNTLIIELDSHTENILHGILNHVQTSKDDSIPNKEEQNNLQIATTNHSNQELENTNQLETEMNVTRKHATDLKHKIGECVQMIKQLRRDKHELEGRWDELEKRNKKTETEYNSLRIKFEEAEKEIRRIHQDKEELQERLSEKLVRGVQGDNAFEDVSQSNRPLVLKDRYEQICSDEWLAAKDSIDELTKNISEEIKCFYLALIFEIAYQEAASKKKEMLNDLSQQVGTLLSGHKQKPKHSGGRKARQDTPREEELTSLLTTYLLDVADQANLDDLYQELTMKLKNQVNTKLKKTPKNKDIKAFAEFFDSWSLGKIKGHDTARPYIRAVGKLAWSMVLQSVPLRFRRDGINEKYNPNTQKMTHTSVQGEHIIVRYYVYPAMYQGDMLVQPGTVFAAPLTERVPVAGQGATTDAADQRKRPPAAGQEQSREATPKPERLHGGATASPNKSEQRKDGPNQISQSRPQTNSLAQQTQYPTRQTDQAPQSGNTQTAYQGSSSHTEEQSVAPTSQFSQGNPKGNEQNLVMTKTASTQASPSPTSLQKEPNDRTTKIKEQGSTDKEPSQTRGQSRGYPGQTSGNIPQNIGRNFPHQPGRQNKGHEHTTSGVKTGRSPKLTGAKQQIVSRGNIPQKQTKF